MNRTVIALLVACMTWTGAAPAGEPRARDLGVPFDGTPGPLNAITDVPGVTVGHVTLIEDLPDGRKVRTGVTAIVPRGQQSIDTPVYAGWFALNGNGEMTGTTYMDELGQIDGPIMLTNTHSVGVVRDAVVAWRVRAGPADPSGYWWSSPVVAETWDGELNDINGFHVRPVHVDRALDEAKGGPVAEGNVGGGTGMTCFDFKCGIGTASRRIDHSDRQYVVGVLVQANYGSGARELLRIAGVPVGQLIGPDTPRSAAGSDTGSIIVVVATDAPLLPHQMKRIARRAALGLGRTGSYAANGSGDIFVAFSTANPAALQGKPLADSSSIGNGHLDPFFASTVEATEEAIANALVAARDMQGMNGHVVRALPHDVLQQLLKRHGRYRAPH